MWINLALKRKEAGLAQQLFILLVFALFHQQLLFALYFFLQAEGHMVKCPREHAHSIFPEALLNMCVQISPGYLLHLFFQLI